MDQREKIGALILIGLFCILGVILYFTSARPSGNTRSIENNIIVEERMKRNSGDR